MVLCRNFQMFPSLIIVSIFCAQQFAIAHNETLESDEAKQQLRVINLRIQKNPQDADGYVERGKFWYEHMHLREARDDLRRSLQIRPTGFAYYWLGRVDFDPKNTKATLNDFAQAERVGAHDFQALVHTSSGYAGLRLYAKAASAQQKALLLHPGDMNVTSWLARNLMRSGQYKDAIAKATEVLNKMPPESVLFPRGAENSNSQFLLTNRRLTYDCASSRGIALLKLHQPAKALRDINLALRVQPNEFELLKARAQAYRETGQNELAKRDEQTAKELSTDNSKFIFDNALFQSK